MSPIVEDTCTWPHEPLEECPTKGSLRVVVSGSSAFGIHEHVSMHGELFRELGVVALPPKAKASSIAPIEGESDGGGRSRCEFRDGISGVRAPNPSDMLPSIANFELQVVPVITRKDPASSDGTSNFAREFDVR